MQRSVMLTKVSIHELMTISMRLMIVQNKNIEVVVKEMDPRLREDDTPTPVTFGPHLAEDDAREALMSQFYNTKRKNGAIWAKDLPL